MKGICRLLLAALMVATLAGCNDDGGSDGVTIQVELSDDCKGIVTQAAGEVESAEFDWKSKEFKLRPGNYRDLALPHAGVYHYHFSAGPHVWDGYQSFSVGYDLPIYLSCL